MRKPELESVENFEAWLLKEAMTYNLENQFKMRIFLDKPSLRKRVLELLKSAYPVKKRRKK